jgi:broad specificity phosphatase PhoE
MGRVYMIRHGKPASTWGDAFEDDPGLDEMGLTQAAAARDALLALSVENRPGMAVSSPLRRCRETAEPFAQALGVELIINPIFGEVPTPKAIAHADRPAWLRKAFAGRWDEIVGDLDYDAWRHDIVRALAELEGHAVFSHYVAINGVVSALTGNPKVLAFKPDHASITAFDVDDGKILLAELGREAVTGVL